MGTRKKSSCTINVNEKKNILHTFDKCWETKNITFWEVKYLCSPIDMNKKKIQLHDYDIYWEVKNITYWE